MHKSYQDTQQTKITFKRKRHIKGGSIRYSMNNTFVKPIKKSRVNKKSVGDALGLVINYLHDIPNTKKTFYKLWNHKCISINCSYFHN